MSLPGEFGTQIETIPAEVPYVLADAQCVAAWQARLDNLPGFRVAIGWQGNPQYRGDRQRSIPLEHFAPLAAVPGVRLVSLQKGEGTQQIAAFRDEAQPHDLRAATVRERLLVAPQEAELRPECPQAELGNEGTTTPLRSRLDAGSCDVAGLVRVQNADDGNLNSGESSYRQPFPLTQFDDLDADGGAFMDTAAILKNVDLLVTSDTALAHLAGAMGVEVWVALPWAADWRWFREREDSPWYPTMRLFRQERRGDWNAVFERIAVELAARSAARVGTTEALAPSQAARAEFQRGTRLAKAGKLDEAAEALRAAIALHADYAEAHHNLGVTLARTGNYADAISAFCRTLAIKPDYGEAAANLGLAYLESGQASQAIAALRQAVQCGRTSADVYNHLGVALARIGKTAEAIEAYRTALRLAPEFAAAHVNLASAFVALERHHEAWLELEWQWLLTCQLSHE